MKKLFSIIVSILFALSVSGLAFAQAPAAKPAAEPVKAEEKAPAKEKKADKKAKKEKQVPGGSGRAETGNPKSGTVGR
jgi:ribosomal protein L12E/L44/L45/RPP1/RPP2